MPLIIKAPSPRLVVKQDFKQIALKNHQVEWSKRAKEILIKHKCYVDTSETGLGKSFIVLWLAKQFNLPLFITCPVTVAPVWEQYAHEYGVKIIKIISYRSVGSQIECQPEHGYVRRIDYTTKEGHLKVKFYATEQFKTVVKNGLIFVCDEAHHLKNKSDQFYSVLALTNEIFANSKSYLAVLSATLFEKSEQVINYIRLLNIVNESKMYYRTEKEIVKTGLDQLEGFCAKINQPLTENIVNSTVLNDKTVLNLCMELYEKIIKKELSGSMLAPERDVSLDIKNGYYKFTEKNYNIDEEINKLAKAVAFNRDTGESNMKEANMGGIVKSLQSIERAKLTDMCRVAIQYLTANDKSKVVIAVYFTDSFNILSNYLSQYKPLILNGKIPLKTREQTVKDFNGKTEHRVLLINSVMGEGISLHDRVGDAPRYMLICPNYYFSKIIQAAGRIYREGIKSNAVVRLFYVKDNLETKILASMVKKSQVLRSTLEEENKERILLPDQYEVIIEE